MGPVQEQRPMVAKVAEDVSDAGDNLEGSLQMFTDMLARAMKLTSSGDVQRSSSGEDDPCEGMDELMCSTIAEEDEDEVETATLGAMQIRPVPGLVTNNLATNAFTVSEEVQLEADANFGGIQADLNLLRGESLRALAENKMLRGQSLRLLAENKMLRGQCQTVSAVERDANLSAAVNSALQTQVAQLQSENRALCAKLERLASKEPDTVSVVPQHLGESGNQAAVQEGLVEELLTAREAHAKESLAREAAQAALVEFLAEREDRNRHMVEERLAWEAAEGEIAELRAELQDKNTQLAEMGKQMDKTLTQMIAMKGGSQLAMKNFQADAALTHTSFVPKSREDTPMFGPAAFPSCDRENLSLLPAQFSSLLTSSLPQSPANSPLASLQTPAVDKVHKTLAMEVNLQLKHMPAFSGSTYAPLLGCAQVDAPVRCAQDSPSCRSSEAPSGLTGISIGSASQDFLGSTSARSMFLMRLASTTCSDPQVHSVGSSLRSEIGMPQAAPTHSTTPALNRSTSPVLNRYRSTSPPLHRSTSQAVAEGFRTLMGQQNPQSKVCNSSIASPAISQSVVAGRLDKCRVNGRVPTSPRLSHRISANRPNKQSAVPAATVSAPKATPGSPLVKARALLVSKESVSAQLCAGRRRRSRSASPPLQGVIQRQIALPSLLTCPLATGGSTSNSLPKYMES